MTPGPLTKFLVEDKYLICPEIMLFLNMECSWVNIQEKKTFFIVPRGINIKLMTDVLGITSLDYDPTNTNLTSAVSDACDQIRDIINND